MDFIPAKESPIFIALFRWYTWFLFKKRFKYVWIKQEYEPCSACKTVYFLNHHSWWDGLVPFLLNEFLFHQKARALMEDKQMKAYPFFKKIGAFSVNRKDPAKAIVSLRYAVRSLQRPHSSLFIYPEGSITPPGGPMQFEGGLTWLHSNLDDVDFVPIGIYQHTIRHNKPELHLHVGQPLRLSGSLSREQRTRYFEKTLDAMLDDLSLKSGFDNSEFERFL